MVKIQYPPHADQRPENTYVVGICIILCGGHGHTTDIVGWFYLYNLSPLHSYVAISIPELSTPFCLYIQLFSTFLYICRVWYYVVGNPCTVRHSPACNGDHPLAAAALWYLLQFDKQVEYSREYKVQGAECMQKMMCRINKLYDI